MGASNVFYQICFRERSSLQLNNRKLERKAKELMLQIDDERLHLTDQKDQVRGMK